LIHYKKINIFIIVPSLTNSGPVKGSIALASLLSKQAIVTLVVLKKSGEMKLYKKEKYSVIKLYKYGNIFRRLIILKNMISSCKKRPTVISSCFSPDIFTLFLKKYANTFTSVRGNLFQNYRYTYGILGFILAFLHLTIISYFDHVIVLSKEMAKQVDRYIGKKSIIIGNFIDEKTISKYKINDNIIDRYSIVFVGTLSKRKCPDIIIKIIEDLQALNYDIALDYIGDGPLKKVILNKIKRKKVKNVTLHGELKNPYPLIASSDIFVLPSYSEGISRACLEALFLGVPCVLRDVDANHEIIKEGVNGYMFKNESDLKIAIIKALKLARTKKCKSLLPHNFTADNAFCKYTTLLEHYFDSKNYI
jgi:glycosyltransferase involved in cell wall biosynthesis